MSQGQQNPWQKDFAFNHWAEKPLTRSVHLIISKQFFYFITKNMYASFNCYITIFQMLATLIQCHYLGFIFMTSKEKCNEFYFLFLTFLHYLQTALFLFLQQKILKITDAKVHNSVFLWFRSPTGSMKRVWSFRLRTIHHLLFLSLKK